MRVSGLSKPNKFKMCIRDSTRARELLVMVGDDAIPGRMAENDRRTRRYSGLRRRLKQGGPNPTSDSDCEFEAEFENDCD